MFSIILCFCDLVALKSLLIQPHYKKKETFDF